MHSDYAIDLAFEECDVLLSNEHRTVVKVNCKQGLHDRYADFWREPERWLIGKVKLGVGHKASTDRDHSPLAAREPSNRRLHELP